MKFIAIVISVFLCGAEIDICVPNFPELKKVFHLSPSTVELILSINLAVHCVAALFVGKVSNIYGKKNTIQYGLILFILGSIFAFFANNFYILLFARLMQGIGISAPLVLSPTLIIDLYGKSKQDKMMNSLNGISTIAICIAPTIGSLCALYFDWKASFFILIILGLISYILIEIFIPYDNYNKNKIIDNPTYKDIFKSKIVIQYIITLSIAIGLYYTFVGMSSLIYVTGLKVSLRDFGFYQGALTLTFGTLSLLSPYLINIFTRKVCVLVSIFLIFGFIIFSSYSVINNITNPKFITMSIIMLSAGCVIPINAVYINALKFIPNGSAVVSSLITTGKWIYTIIGVQLTSYFYNGGFNSTGIFMIISEILVIIFIINLFIKHKDLRHSFM